jgi:YegS/Rv2252/BmrU family lipid kinase
MRHLFLVNPAAGQGQAERELLPVIEKTCAEAAVDFDIHLTKSTEEIISFTKEQANSGEHIRFYACGGDGTLNNVLNGVMGYSNAELAFVPCGTGNDFARNFTNRAYFTEISRQLTGTSISIDAICIGESYALNMFNIGVDCDVVVEVEKLKKKPFFKGSLAYIAGAVKALSKSKSYRLMIELDDGTKIDEELFLAVVANGSFYGGGFKSAPLASVTDGQIDVCIVRPVKGFKIIKMLAGYRQGIHLSDSRFAPYIIYKTCKKLSIQAFEPMNISIDGELATFESLQFAVVPGAIKFSMPSGSLAINR